MNKIFNFIFQNNDIPIILDKNNNIWFQALPICAILNYSNKHKAIYSHVEPDDIRQYHKIELINKDFHHKSLFITESGLYCLVLKSKQKEALDFQKWIIRDVLPNIRKYGEYKLKKELKEELNNKILKIISTKDEIIKKLTRKLHKEIYEKGQLVYVHVYTTYEKYPLYKIGYSKKLDKRIMNYGTGHTDNGSIVFHIKCHNMKLVEDVLKHKLKWCLYDKNREMVKIKLDELILIIEETIHDLDDKIIKDDVEQLLTNSDNELDASNKELIEIKKILSN